MSHPTANTLPVLVIVDPRFGEKLRSVPVGQPVWITMSPANELIVRRLWECQEALDHLTGITGFRFDDGVSAEDRFVAELGTIDLHHGPYSSAPPYTEIVVKGARLTAEIRAELSELGFADFAETEDGFAAKRSHEEAMRQHEGRSCVGR
jgi:hypothetical protein